MGCKVVRPFPYAGNGYTLENLVPGDERDFGAATSGLVAAGFIAASSPGVETDADADAAADAGAVEKPRRGRPKRR